MGDIFDMGYEAADAPTELDLRIQDCYARLGHLSAGRDRGLEIAEIVDRIYPLGTLGELIARCIADYSGSKEQIKDRVFLATRELREYLAEQWAKEDRG